MSTTFCPCHEKNRYSQNIHWPDRVQALFFEKLHVLENVYSPKRQACLFANKGCFLNAQFDHEIRPQACFFNKHPHSSKIVFHFLGQRVKGLPAWQKLLVLENLDFGQNVRLQACLFAWNSSIALLHKLLITNMSPTWLYMFCLFGLAWPYTNLDGTTHNPKSTGPIEMEKAAWRTLSAPISEMLGTSNPFLLL